MNIAVYCGSVTGHDAIFTKRAEELGQWIADHHHTLIFGGGNIGLMGTVAEAVFRHEGKVIGVLPANIDFIIERPQPFCTEIIQAPDMASRKVKMMELADAYIALPGGIGTLDELTEIMTLIRIDYYRKPAVIFNINNYYEPFKSMLDQMIDNGFMDQKDLDRVLFSDRLEEIESFLLAQTAVSDHNTAT